MLSVLQLTTDASLKVTQICQKTKDKHFIGLQIVVKFFREVNLCGRKFSSVPSELFDETVRTIFTIYWVFI